MTRSRRRAFGAAPWLGAAVVVLSSQACSDTVGPPVPVATTVEPSVASLSLDALGDTTRIAAGVLDQEGNPIGDAPLIWSSSSNTVATVSATGLVRAVGNGTTTISVGSGAALAEVPVTVTQRASAIVISMDRATLSALGDTMRLSATVQDPGGSAIPGARVAWTALDTSVATVSTDGLVEGVANGTTAIAAVSGAAFATASITVAQQPADIALSVSSLTFASLGDTARVIATVRDALGTGANGAPVTWSSSDTTVVTASGDGMVESKANGNAVVTATSDQATGSVSVTVQQVVASLLLAPDSIVLQAPGDAASLTLLAYDALGMAIAAPTVTWSSSDDAVATVDDSGTVTAVARAPSRSRRMRAARSRNRAPAWSRS